MALNVWSANKKFVVNNFLKHFFVALLAFGLLILGEYLTTGAVKADSELILFLIMIAADVIAAIVKGLEEYNAEWAEKFQWFFIHFFAFLKKLLYKLLRKNAD